MPYHQNELTQSASFKMFLVKEYPACVIVERETRDGLVHIFTTDTVCYTEEVTGRHFTPGSVVRYAQEYMECPIAAVERAVKNGHDLYWLNENAICISNSKCEQQQVVLLRDGTGVKFEGKTFTIRVKGGRMKLEPLDINKA